VITWHGRLRAAGMLLRMHSQAAGFVIGSLLASVSARLWYRGTIGPILGTFLVGLAAAVLAAAIFAYISPFNEPAFRRFLSLGVEKVWPSRQAIEDPYWVDRVHGAKMKCTLLGIAHGKWCDDQRFRPTLHERLNHGLMFKMFFLDPESPAADLRAIEEMRQNGRDTRDAIRKSIKAMWEFRQGLDAGLKDQLRLYVYTATPSCGLMWIDQTMVVTHYLPALPDVTSPALLITPPQGGIEGSLYNIYARNVEKMESTFIDEGNIHRFLPREAPEQQSQAPASNLGGTSSTDE
jgi:hypothetical protein